SVVGDGAYLGDFVVQNGKIETNHQSSQIWVGYSYSGVIKTLPLGFVADGMNTQTTFKAISRVGLRFTHSMSGLYGTDIYDMKPIAEWQTGMLNYLPNRL